MQILKLNGKGIQNLYDRNLYARKKHVEERVRQIPAAQMPVAEKAARADVVIDTDQPLAAVQAQVVAALKASR